MKFTTIYLGENKIELFNSILGKETVKVNGQDVSSKFSLLGTDHIFKINEDEREVECKLSTGFGLHGVVISFYKNDKPVIESPKNGCLGVFLIAFVVLFLIDVIYRLLT